MQSSERDLFLAAAAEGANFIPISRSWPADLETPVSTWMKIGQGQPPGVLLESVEGGETIGRWSVIATNPLWTATARGDHLLREWRDGSSDEFRGNPFEGLRTWLSEYQSIGLEEIPPLGQLYGVWGYELIKWIEPKVPVHTIDKLKVPDGIWMFMDNILIFDQVKRIITAVVYADFTQTNSLDELYTDCIERIENLEAMMSAPLPQVRPMSWQKSADSPLTTTSNFAQEEFESAVQIVKKYIASGDVFQLVLSQRLETQIDQEPFELYRSLRMINPSPYMAFFDFGDWQLIGSSPEVMVKAYPTKEGILASLRPIAGTRPRGCNHAEDKTLEAELLNDPKERAEHVMLVDLGRNDLGRVCHPGSVAVKELMVIERYSHVMHIVSQVEGFLSKGMDVWDLLMASFPAGTVSGAPKIRAMQIIHELEPDGRGPYSGVYGSIDLSGALNTAITIRTMIVNKHSEGGLKVQVQAGAGIVADSIPKNEYQETINKAKGLLKALACFQSNPHE